MSQTLRVTHLNKVYGKKKVVTDASLHLSRGEVVGILGPNGSGKTTTFYMIAGLVRHDAGSIYLDAEDIGYLPIHARAKKGIGYLPQEASIFRELSVEDNINAIIELRDNIDRKQKKLLLEKLLDDFSLQHVRKSLGMSLSGGERKRAEIARMLAIQPRFLLFDEPFAGVDPVSVDAMQKLILSLKSDNFGVLMTDHNVRETLAICDRAYVLLNGKIIISGTQEEIYADEMVRRHYLGNDFA